MVPSFKKDFQYVKFCAYGFLKNLRFFEPFLILYLIEKGLNYFQVGTIYSIRMIVRLIFEIPSGVIADVLGRRRTMIFSYAMYLISFVTYAFAEGYSLIVTATFIFAIGDAFRTGTHKAMIFDYLKIKGWEDQKVHYYGHTRSWSQNGSAVSSLLAAAIVFFSGNYSAIFLLTGIPYIIGLILLASYPKSLEGIHRQKTKVKDLWKTFRDILSEIIASFRKVKTAKAIINMSSFSGYFAAVKDYLQPVLRTLIIGLPVFLSLETKKREAVIIGLVYFILYFFTAGASRNSGRVAQKSSHLAGVLNSLLILGLTAGIIGGLFYVFNLVWITVLVMIIIQIVENLRRPVAVSCISELFSNTVLASVLSVESQLKDLLGAVIALFFGFVADKLGLGYGFILTSALILLTVPLFFIMESMESKKAHEKD